MPDAARRQAQELVESIIADCDGRTRYPTTTVTTTVAQLVAWSWTGGTLLGAVEILDPYNVEAYAVHLRTRMRGGGAANYRAILRAVGAIVLPTAYPKQVPLPASDPTLPYTETEVRSLVAWARGLPTPEMRHNAMSVLACSLGAGLAPAEIAMTRTNHVSFEFGAIQIELAGRVPRTTVVRREWESTLVDLIVAVPDGAYLFRPGRSHVRRAEVTNYLERCPRESGPKLSAQRCRNTWIIEHLRSGVPALVLCEAAGITSEQLGRYLRHAVGPEDSPARELLRGK